jgi:hypothetical protein
MLTGLSSLKSGDTKNRWCMKALGKIGKGVGHPLKKIL